MTVIGLTGPTGAGKTTALGVLEELGARVVDCDALYYALLASDEGLRRRLTDTFGNVFCPDGQLNRPLLGKLVFTDPRALERLNAIVFPAVRAAVEEQIDACTAPALVIDAINLIESGLGALCDFTVALTAPAEVRLRRIMERDGIGEDYARSRIAAQKKDSYYQKHCTFLLRSCAETRGEFCRLIREFFADFIINDREDETWK